MLGGGIFQLQPTQQQPLHQQQQRIVHQQQGQIQKKKISGGHAIGEFKLLKGEGKGGLVRE